MIDGWFTFKSVPLARENPVEIRLHPHTGIHLSSDFNYEHWSVELPSSTLPLGYFEAQPVVGKRCVTLHLEVVDDDTINILIAGNTWCFRSRLDALSCPGAYHESENGEKTYYRILKSVNATTEKGRVLDLLEGCFKRMALRAIVDKEADSSTSAAAAFVSELRELPMLHFQK